MILRHTVRGTGELGKDPDSARIRKRVRRPGERYWLANKAAEDGITPREDVGGNVG
jgi:hypothetical protein